MAGRGCPHRQCPDPGDHLLTGNLARWRDRSSSREAAVVLFTSIPSSEEEEITRPVALSSPLRAVSHGNGEEFMQAQMRAATVAWCIVLWMTWLSAVNE